MHRSGIACLAAVLLAGCAGTGTGPGGVTMAHVTGSVTYRERIALPPTAVVTVRLVDVSLADAPATLIGEQQIMTNGRQVPFRFSIPYDAGGIDPRLSYAVQARIEDGSRLLFISDRHHPVISRGAPTEVDLVLKRVGDHPPPAPRRPDGSS